MNIYLDVSCLNRPFDNQTQPRIRLESDAVTMILSRIDSGQWTQAASQMSEFEIAAISEEVRRRRVLQLLPQGIMKLSAEHFHRARELVAAGLAAADAVHVAAAESLLVDVFLTCDDRLLHRCQRIADQLKIRAANPVTWLQEQNP